MVTPKPINIGALLEAGERALRRRRRGRSGEAFAFANATLALTPTKDSSKE